MLTREEYWASKITEAERKANEVSSSYIGNKRKILGWIGATLNKEGFFDRNKYFIDAFGGSGIVSYFFSRMGIKGSINELLYFSHTMHKAMFSHYEGPLTTEAYPKDFESLVPPGVKFLSYDEVPIATASNADKAKKPKKQDMLSLYGLETITKHEVEKVALGVNFESENRVFDQLFAVMKPFIGRNLSAKEAFEFACVLTQGILNGYDEYAFTVPDVRCYQGDTISFLREQKFLTPPEETFIYLDPPYGFDNSNSKYYMIYDMMEVITYAFYQLRDAYHRTSVIMSGVKDSQLAHWGSEEPWKYVPICKDIKSEVEWLPHIETHALKFSKTDTFTPAFINLIEACAETGCRDWAFSFAEQASFAPPEEIADLISRKGKAEVKIYKIDYTYAGRKKQEGDETTNISGLKENDKEVLFVCRKK